MRYIDQVPVPYYQFESLPANDRLIQAIFTRHGGVSQGQWRSLNMSSAVGDNPEHLRQNRALAYGVAGRATDTLVHAHLTHDAAVARVTQADNGRLAGKVDAIITDEPGCGLAMNYADCTPIFIYDPVHEAIGLGHAGWQGAVKDLPGALVRAMTAAFGSRPADLIAGVGPCIGPCCYEVGPNVIDAVQAAFDRPDAFLIPQPDGPRPHFDLPGANEQNLRRAGVRQVEQSGLCTACRTDLFFSHRAEKGKTGRFGVMFVLSA